MFYDIIDSIISQGVKRCQEVSKNIKNAFFIKKKGIF